MSDLVKKEANEMALNMQRVEDKIVVIRNLEVIADADVAALYGVETKRVNEAVRNNPEKFPARYMFELTLVSYKICGRKFRPQMYQR